MTCSEPTHGKTAVIRPATRDDVPAMVRLLADDAIGKTRETAGDTLPVTYYDAFDEIDRSTRDELIVAEIDGLVVGTLQLTLLRDLTHQGGRRAQVEAVRVEARYRGYGIGAQMFAWVVEQARRAGCHLVQLTTNNQRTDAQRFYQRLGFVASHAGMKLDLHPRTTPEPK